jgi:tricorn protease
MKRITALLLLFICPLIVSADESKPYYHSPAISADGTTIAFVHNNDIYIVPATGGVAQLVVAHEALDYNPRFSPDGEMLAFSSRRSGGSDVYTLNLNNGEINRLTWYSGSDDLQTWSPDGKYIYFTSGREGYNSTRIYRIPVNGGIPVPIAFEDYEPYRNAAISPDGKTIAFNTNDRIQQWWRTGPVANDATQIWLKTNSPEVYDFRKFTDNPGKDTWPMWAPDGTGLYYVSNEYDPTVNLLPENIYFKPLEGERQQITSFTDGRVTNPVIAANSGDIVFERDFGIWLLPAKGEAAPVEISAFADYKLSPVEAKTYTRGVQEFSLSPDNKKVAFIIHGEVFVAPAKKEKDDPVPTAFRVTETAGREDGLAWDKDSNRLFYISNRDGNPEVYMHDFLSGEEKRLTNTEKPEAGLVPSPDGKWLAYYSGIEEIRLINLEDMSDSVFQKGLFMNETAFNSPQLAWSPDSKWLAFCDRDENYFSNIFARKVGEESEAIRITNLPNIGTSLPKWSNDGRFIVFSTWQHRTDIQMMRVDLVPLDKEFEEDKFEKLFEEPEKKDAKDSEDKSEETKGDEEKDEKDGTTEESKIVIQREGIEDRLTELASWSKNSYPLAISPDDKKLLFINRNTGKFVLWSISADPTKSDDAKQLLTLAGGINSIQFAKDKQTMWFDNGPMIVRLSLNGGAPKPYQLKAEMEIDFEAEKAAAFREAWVLLRENFYDAKMNGLDWDAVYNELLPYIKGARTNYEFQRIVLHMLGDLNASHLGIYGSVASGQNVAVGDLGLNFDPAALAKGEFKISGIVPGGAVEREKAEVEEGDYLVAINNVALNSETNIYEILSRTIGKRVILKVADSAAAEETREVKVMPMPTSQTSGLRYNQWVNQNRKYVDKVSNGRLGYLHIAAMGSGNLEKFKRDLTAEARQKDGVVIDVRYNNGGYVAPFVLEILQRRTSIVANFRGIKLNSSANMAGNRVMDKPTILVQNERSLSNAEMFAEGYRRLGLGKIVGSGSNGWVIWTWGRGLVNGMFLRLPRVMVETLDGEDLDVAPRDPDVFVERPMGESHLGKDSQLDAAVKTLLEQIDGN